VSGNRALIGTYTEPGRELPVLGAYDVAVCGGGPAGCAAAIAAARRGANTLLIEKDGYLGGAAVSQLVCVVLSTNGVDFQGVWHEYARALQSRGGISKRLEGVGTGQIRGVVDPEAVKYAWDDLLSAAGVDVLHHACCAGAIVEDGKIGGVILETRAGRAAVRARRIIDATGDGAVCAQAGATWEQGDGEHNYAMACTKVFRMGNVDVDRGPFSDEEMRRIEAALDQAIADGEITHPVLTAKSRLLGYIRGWLWKLPPHRREILSVISRVLKVDPLDPWALTAAEREGREQARQAAGFLRRHVPGFGSAYLLDTSNQIGLRSSRRIRGLATVTADDARGFRKYGDGIARSSWNIDIWPADSYTAPAVDRGSEEYRARREKLIAGEHFDIRYGCLVPEGVDNLLVAGRCISSEHVAQSSLRIQQTCMATGQAAGAAAALSLQQHATPRELDPMLVVAQLDRDRDIEPAFEELKGLPVAPRAR